VALALADTVGESVAVDVVGGADDGEPQEASMSATHTPEKTVTADDSDADRRTKALLQKVRKDDGLIVRRPTLEKPWNGSHCDQTVAFIAQCRRFQQAKFNAEKFNAATFHACLAPAPAT
jgi:hypothetical protein